MIAQSNHTIDRTLESVLENIDGIRILRLGGQSQSDYLKPYLYSKLTNDYKTKKENPQFRKNKNESSRSLEIIEGNFNSFNSVKKV